MASISVRQSVRLRNKMASGPELLETKPEGWAASSSTHCTTRQRNKMGRKVDASDGTLPDDVVTEILSWLPPKPFFRFKCVSKTWCALSTVAYDRNKHFQPTVHGLFYNTFRWEASREVYHFTIKKSCIGFVNVSTGADEVDNAFNVSLDSDNLKVVDCCNGLLLVEGWDLESGHATDLYVYNPATQSILAVWCLPPPKRLLRFYEVFLLAFDPCVQSHIHVVCFTGWCKGGVEYNFLRTFSFKTGKWKSEKKLGHGVRIIKSAKGIFVNGRLHCLTTSKEILSIDPIRCSYQMIQPPHSQPTSRLYIGQSQGLLNFLTLDNTGLSIWTLKSFDQQEWVLKHRLSKVNFHNIVAVHPGKNIMFLASRHNRLSSFDLNTGEEEDLCPPLVIPHTSSPNIWIYMPFYLK